MLDSHCHLDDPRLDDDRAAAIADARAAGVTGWLVPGVDPRRLEAACALHAAEPGVHLAAGLHPWVAGELAGAARDDALAALETKLDRVCALGECGLDRHRARDAAARGRQEHAFVAQLQMACSHGLPLILHVVRAHGRALELLEAHRPPAGGIVHAFRGPAESIPRYARLGLSFGIGFGLLRRPAEQGAAVLRAIPAGHLLLETDAPDQPARPGELNPPAALPDVAAGVAARLGRPAGEVAAASDAALEALVGAWPR